MNQAHSDQTIQIRVIYLFIFFIFSLIYEHPNGIYQLSSGSYHFFYFNFYSPLIDSPSLSFSL